MHESADSYCPDLIVAPMLKTAIPEVVWRKYPSEELEEMYLNFYSPQSQYHEARRRFVYKLSCLISPLKELIRSLISIS